LTQKESAMKKCSVPEFSEFDLDFRPAGYFTGRDLKLVLPSDIAGQMRREYVRRKLAAGEAVPDELAAPTLTPEQRQSIGSIHPRFMGGEYLPPLADDEVEIARVSLESTTFDQISVRARRTDEGIRYSIRDEYEDDGQSIWDCRPRQSAKPLKMCEVIAMLDGAAEDGGVVLSPLKSNWCGDPERSRRFVTVESDFYPDLGYYYAARVDQWIDEKKNEEGEDE
jgi:hypothetical protein